MTWIPTYIPLWCWVLQGSDVVFFSQRTTTWDGTADTVVDGGGACLARCGDETQIVMHPEHPNQLTPPIQCGKIAGLDARGRYLCEDCLPLYWTCATCEAWLPHGDGGFCSDVCRDAYNP